MPGHAAGNTMQLSPDQKLMYLVDLPQGRLAQVCFTVTEQGHAVHYSYSTFSVVQFNWAELELLDEIE